MSDPETPEFSATDYPVTLYLNQRLIFDLLGPVPDECKIVR